MSDETRVLTIACKAPGCAEKAYITIPKDQLAGTYRVVHVDDQHIVQEWRLVESTVSRVEPVWDSTKWE